MNNHRNIIFTDVLSNFFSKTSKDNLVTETQRFFDRDQTHTTLLSRAFPVVKILDILDNYNQEYLQLIPQFYYYLELRNRDTIDAIFEQLLAVKNKYLTIIKSSIEDHIEWEMFIHSISADDFNLELQEKLKSVWGENWQQTMIELLADSYFKRYFNYMPEPDVLANENAKNFYQAFRDNLDFDYLATNYFVNLRNQIPGMEDFQYELCHNPKLVKDFFYSRQEAEKAKFDYVISPDALRRHPYSPLRKHVSESRHDSNGEFYIKRFLVDWRRSTRISGIFFEDDLLFENVEADFLKNTGQQPSTENKEDFDNFCLNAFYERYGKKNMDSLMRHYSQSLYDFAVDAVILFDADKPFKMANKEYSIRPVFIGDVIELHCMLQYKTLVSLGVHAELLKQKGWLQGINPELISFDEGTKIAFPGTYEWKWRLDTKRVDKGFEFDVNSVTASNMVFAQFADGTAAYGLSDESLMDENVYPDGPPMNNHAYEFSQIVNCANEQEALRQNANDVLFHQVGERFKNTTQDFLAITNTIGETNSLGNIFNSCESAGNALLKRILKRDRVTEDIVAILENKLERPYLTEQQCDVLMMHTKAALEKHNAKTIENCNYLISVWEKERDKLLEQSIEGDHSASDNLDHLYSKLFPTYKIKKILAVAQPQEHYYPSLSTMVAATNKAAKLFEDNLEDYAKERNPVWRKALYSIAIALAIPTAGITLLAAFAYSYATTGSILFYSPHASTRSNTLRESLQNTGVCFKN